MDKDAFNKDLSAADSLKVIRRIMNHKKLYEYEKLCIIQQFILNWITVGVVYEK
jgi:hypothetical protein